MSTASMSISPCCPPTAMWTFWTTGAAKMRWPCAAKSPRCTAQANALKREREQLRTDARERARMLDLYRFQQEEIAGANLQPGEEEELAADRSRLANSEKLSAAAGEAYALLSGGERGGGSALDALNAALAVRGARGRAG